jgi:hypothetical protein
MKKIIIDKTEDIAEVIDRILGEQGDDIALVIPKSSALGKSVRNFNLLKREVDSAGKSVAVESVDETILAFAKQAGIEASHPLWKSVRGAGGFSDIVPKSDGAEEDAAESHAKKTARSRKAEPKQEAVRLKVREEETVEASITSDADAETDEEAAAETSIEENRFFKRTTMPPAPRGDDDADDDDETDGGRRISAKAWWTLGAVVIAIGIVAYALTLFWNRADITISFKQDPWSYQGNFTANKSAAAIDPTSNTIPAQIFTSNKNITETFPASSIENVSLKAQGEITIYNAYNSSPQELVATTRFVTPDGKIFRLVNNVTVPGAQVVNGAITPSSINAPIVADQAGPDYNVGPVSHLSVPGFQNDTARYNGFYGVITSSTSGGYIGKKAVPTAADVTAAKASTTAILQAGLSSGFTTSYPNNFKILDGATTYQVSKLMVSTTTDADGNFTVFGQATMEAIGFDESALKTYLLSLAQNQESNSVFSSINLDYGSVQANFATGQVTFALTAQGELEPAFSPSDFTASILGQSIANARSTILALPNLQDGKISVWPLWLWNIPSDPNKVHVTYQ